VGCGTRRLLNRVYFENLCFSSFRIQVILDPKAVGDGAGIGIDVCLEGSDTMDQVFGGGSDDR